MVRAVLFDAAGTLLRVHPSVGEIYAREAKCFGVHVPAAAIDEAFVAVWRALRPYADGSTPFHTSEVIERAWWRNLVGQTFEKTCGIVAFGDGFDEFFDSLYRRFEQPDVWRLFDDVLPTLDGLREQRIPLAVVSNWDSRLPRLLDALNIAQQFQFVLTSAEAGVSKPSPLIFRQAVERLGFQPHEVLHIGDSLEDDVLAAQRAGLRGLHLRRTGTNKNSSCETTIRSLIEILDVLALSRNAANSTGHKSGKSVCTDDSLL